jgi:thiol-disulfide isomerase/thioredoxin
MTLMAASGPSASAEDASPDPRAILERSKAAASSLYSVSFDAEWSGDGALKDEVGRASGHVIAKRASDEQNHSVVIKGVSADPGQKQGEPFHFAFDGATAFDIRDRLQRYTYGPLKDMSSDELNLLFPPMYFGPSVFRVQLERATLTYAGKEKADGVDCHVIGARLGRGEFRYFIGEKDYLVRRMENLVQRQVPGQDKPQQGRYVFSVENLETNPDVSKEPFRLECPDGYAKVVPESKGLLAQGKAAPDWVLSTPDGRRVSLRSLRGKVVVMDFWASWCKPCMLVMPGLQDLHDRFKGKPVEIIGINCRQRARPTSEAIDYLKAQGYTYTHLIEGDEVADLYHVQGLPTVYIISPDGKVIYATHGFQQRLHEYIGYLIDRSLPRP